MGLQQPNATIQEAHWKILSTIQEAHWKILLLIEKLKKKGEEEEKTNIQTNVDDIIYT